MLAYAVRKSCCTTMRVLSKAKQKRSLVWQPWASLLLFSVHFNCGRLGVKPSMHCEELDISGFHLLHWQGYYTSRISDFWQGKHVDGLDLVLHIQMVLHNLLYFLKYLVVRLKLKFVLVDDWSDFIEYMTCKCCQKHDRSYMQLMGWCKNHGWYRQKMVDAAGTTLPLMAKQQDIRHLLVGLVYSFPPHIFHLSVFNVFSSALASNMQAILPPVWPEVHYNNKQT